MPVCYHPGMNRLLRVAFVVSLVAATPVPAPAADDPLGRARVLYNQGQFEAAVNAAELARLVPGRGDSADLVAARAYLERFRVSDASDDLTNARERLRRLDPQRLPPRERVEYIVGLGEALYLDQSFGAASAVFDSVLQSGELTAIGARDRVLDWWADAQERDGRPRPDMDRRAVYQRIRLRMDRAALAALDVLLGAATPWRCIEEATDCTDGKSCAVDCPALGDRVDRATFKARGTPRRRRGSDRLSPPTKA